MKVVIPGGSGFLGRSVAKKLIADGHEPVVITRSPRTAEWRQVAWDGKSIGDWAAEMEGADAVLNLAGRSVNCRYNERNKAEIYASRLDSTRVIGQAIRAAKKPPPVWLNSSTATIYRHSEDRPMDEETGEIGKGFSVDVAQKWEAELEDADTPQTRKVAMRSAMVMGPEPGGPFEPFYQLARKGLGGPMGGGLQMVSWIHIDDFYRAMLWLIERGLPSPVNVCAPGPLTNRDFVGEVVKAVGAKIALPMPRFAIEIGAFFMGTESELPMKSRWVVPKKLLDSGFEFRFPFWPEAARDIVACIRGAKVAA